MLSRIYTKTGDDGTTTLGDFSRRTKTDLRLAAYADVDEANSAIGVAVTTGGLADDVVALLIRIQNELFDVGADLCNPVVPDPALSSRCGSTRATSAGLEQACDAYNESLPMLRSFVLPGGTPGGALLHVARTVVRRAERTGWAAVAGARRGDEPARGQVPEQAVRPAVHPRRGWPTSPTATCCGSQAASAERAQALLSPAARSCAAEVRSRAVRPARAALSLLPSSPVRRCSASSSDLTADLSTSAPERRLAGEDRHLVVGDRQEAAADRRLRTSRTRAGSGASGRIRTTLPAARMPSTGVCPVSTPMSPSSVLAIDPVGVARPDLALGHDQHHAQRHVSALHDSVMSAPAPWPCARRPRCRRT